MHKYGLNELRKMYLDFFESKAHYKLPSFPLVPRNDPSVLLINAGMTPMKPYFTGEQEPPSKRVTTCQKCFRAVDIDNVGVTARHATFFEMLGNFSFGDYFKQEAIGWAWEFITDVLNLPQDKLWVTVYLEDDEAYYIWKKRGFPEGRIVKLGKKDNFWEHGTGPCGPSSEIHLDRGEAYGCGRPDCKPGCDCDRFIEFWNLVFTQFNKDENGDYTLLQKKNIDTGMGLERLACVVQQVDSIFDVDTIKNIIRHICRISGVEYGNRPGHPPAASAPMTRKSDTSVRIIADHMRGAVMMAAEGILPSNEGRGYILRRLLRRAARHGKLIGLDRPFLCEIADTAIKESSDAYPELDEKSRSILRIISAEEERFNKTIDLGLGILNEYISGAKMEKAAATSGATSPAISGATSPAISGAISGVISGDQAFKLHDTYGFPLDLTREIALENGLVVDEEGFKAEMQKQRVRAREAAKAKDASAWIRSGGSHAGGMPTEFTGYAQTESEAVIILIMKDGEPALNAEEGQAVTLLLDKTPFYGESGGQAGDTGTIIAAGGIVRIDGCRKTADGKFLHTGIVENGSIEQGETAIASIDVNRRRAIARNHTATHLLQKALRNILGQHVSQSGSLVESDRLRFDFTHPSPVTSEEIVRIEDEVNGRILDGIRVDIDEMPVAKAKELGATALFGEKYGDVVRVVKIGEYSMELCGGTHLESTSAAGLFKITTEGGVAAGIRRIEAVTGSGALDYLNGKARLLESAASLLKTIPADIEKKIESVNLRLKESDNEIRQLRGRIASFMIDGIIAAAPVIKGVKLVKARFDEFDGESLREAADRIKAKIGNGSGIVVLASSFDSKAGFIVAVTGDLASRGVNAGKIVGEVARAAGGGGGGRPDMAQAGAKDISKIDQALALADEVVEAMLQSCNNK